MKKFYIYNEAAVELNAVYFDFQEGGLGEVLAVDYIQETGGDPVTSEEQDTGLDELLGMAATEVTDATWDDLHYVADLCKAWGLL